jgi:histidine triad (HIT) family protein
MSEPCFLCHKHKHAADYIGERIAEDGGLSLSHFPFLPDEKAVRGHLIIEPLRHITNLSEMNDAETDALGRLIRAGTRAMQAVLKAEHVYLLRINDKVAHLHFHLVPRYAGTPREHWGAKIMDWPDRPIVTLPQIRDLARRLKDYCSVTGPQ